MKLLIFILCLFVVGAVYADDSAVKKATKAAHYYVRATVEPPCDYRNRRVNGKWVRSPCNNKKGNHLPKLSWSDEMAASAKAYVESCPSTHSLNLGDGIGENLYLSFKHAADITDEQLIWAAVQKWEQGSFSYNAQTGECNGICKYYKQMIATNNKKVGCAIKRGCGGSKIVVACHYKSTPAEGPAYPVLEWTPALEAQFEHQLLKAMKYLRYKESRRRKRRARRRRQPKPAALGPVSWSETLENQAQAHIDTLTTVATEDANANQLVFIHPTKTYASGAFPAICSRLWIRSQQVLGEATKEMGCAQKWHKGNTIVVCNFNK